MTRVGMFSPQWAILAFTGITFFIKGDENCRTVEFKEERKNEVLINHVSHRYYGVDKDICQINCYREPGCVSYNHGMLRDGTFLCELNDKDHTQASPNEMVARYGSIYRPILNPCGSSPCTGHSKCQSGFGDQEYHCSCLLGFYGEECELAFDDCSDVLNVTGVYYITNRGWDSFPVLCDQSTDGGGWTMVFKFVDGVSPSTEVSSLWSANSSSHSEDALDVTATHRQHYINSIVKNWETFDPKEARVVLYASGIEVAFLKFNASATSNVNWFSQNRLLQSQWSDLKTATNIYEFSIPGNLRYFEISGPYAGCENDSGWFLITTHPYCTWEDRIPIPSIIYSKLNTSVNWNDYGNVGIADAMIVYIR